MAVGLRVGNMGSTGKAVAVAVAVRPAIRRLKILTTGGDQDRSRDKSAITLRGQGTRDGLTKWKVKENIPHPGPRPRRSAGQDTRQASFSARGEGGGMSKHNLCT
jgi:hypothetical protein